MVSLEICLISCYITVSTDYFWDFQFLLVIPLQVCLVVSLQNTVVKLPDGFTLIGICNCLTTFAYGAWPFFLAFSASFCCWIVASSFLNRVVIVFCSTTFTFVHSCVHVTLWVLINLRIIKFLVIWFVCWFVFWRETLSSWEFWEVCSNFIVDHHSWRDWRNFLILLVLIIFVVEMVGGWCYCLRHILVVVLIYTILMVPEIEIRDGPINGRFVGGQLLL